jgi:hypothetical protein
MKTFWTALLAEKELRFKQGSEYNHRRSVNLYDNVISDTNLPRNKWFKFNDFYHLAMDYPVKTKKQVI